MGGSERSPTAVRRELGQRLRGLRVAKDLTLDETSKLVGCSPSKITKIELAQLVASRDDVVKLLDVYGETDTEQQAMLLAMVREGKRKEWWESHRDIPPKFGNYLGLESVASALHAYDTHVVHGLLQTPGYARALCRAAQPDKLPDEIEQIVDIRLRRQEVLVRADPAPLTLWSIMDETVLRRPVGGKETMYAQIQYLIGQADLPNVNLLVLPNDLGAHAGLDGPFSVLQFEASTRPVIYIEGQAGNLYLEKSPDIRRCQQALDHMLAIAPSPACSVILMQQIAKEMQP